MTENDSDIYELNQSITFLLHKNAIIMIDF